MTRQLIMAFCLMAASSLCGQHGKAVLVKNISYEIQDDYFPHDKFVEEEISDWIDKEVLVLEERADYLRIENYYNDGFTGHHISITVRNDYSIDSVSYSSWDDVYDHGQIEYNVTKCVLILNEQFSRLKEGLYILQVDEIRSRVDQASAQKISDTTAFVFQGKFKDYSNNEFQLGSTAVKGTTINYVSPTDAGGIIYSPTTLASHRLGDSLLKRYILRFVGENNLSEYCPDDQETGIGIIVNADGTVDKDSLHFSQGNSKNSKLLKLLAEDQTFMNEWVPAIHYNSYVKSYRYIHFLQPDQ